MEVGEVRIAEDTDFKDFKQTCIDHTDWKRVYNKHEHEVYTKKNDKSAFKMIKCVANYPDIPAPVLYDVLHDGAFRNHWDDNCISTFETCLLNLNNDIGYYALRCPSPLKNRDFVLLRSWLEMGNDYFICSHSVDYQDLPVKKDFVRAVSYQVGYYIHQTGKTGCVLYYVSQVDPKGRLPSWSVNRATSYFAPKLMKKIYKACHDYDTWKSKQKNPRLKPWLYPEQHDLPRYDPKKIGSINNLIEAAEIDETAAPDTLSPSESENGGLSTASSSNSLTNGSTIKPIAER